MAVLFEWDPAKATANERKHGVSFELARRVFSDPWVLVEQDRIENGEYRWRAAGRVGSFTVFIVAHTYPNQQDDIIRIISARSATSTERRGYEQYLRSQQL